MYLRRQSYCWKVSKRIKSLLKNQTSAAGSSAWLRHSGVNPELYTFLLEADALHLRSAQLRCLTSGIELRQVGQSLGLTTLHLSSSFSRS